MNEIKNQKQYDLEERTFQFAKNTRLFVSNLPKKLTNMDDIKQLIRSSGSIGANYIEANDSLSKKDFIMRIKISRKEAKETRFWLRLIDENAKDRDILLKEATELMNILGAILKKSE